MMVHLGTFTMIIVEMHHWIWSYFCSIVFNQRLS